MAGEVWVTNTKMLRSRMKGKLSCPVLKTSGAGDSLAEFNYAPISYLFFTLAVERIMKGIADNVSELINAKNNFCLPISNRSR
jgi:hypothetical protein